MVKFVASCLLAVIFLSGCGDLETSSSVSSITISPSSITVGIAKSTLFSAIVKNSAGNIISASPTWSVSGTGSINSSTGLFTAGSASGEGTVTATYGGISDTAAVTTTINGWVAGRVLDSLGKKVQDIKVYLIGTSLEDFTDSDGDYSIPSVPAGTYEVWTDRDSSIYRAASKEATVVSGETETVNFTILYFTDPPDLNPPVFEFE
ncbi:hypothetical protein A3H38_02500 [candidate division WOR-1 bacterium RIFCSPLOWO2_02_FULL_46_20]|uniref:BIG2 domain-containing protein n=1 Tax=candidate division WOR-1 bacterium RIFCSPLOWO2_02_FULL_46_20 TaxID=1802567 RepID=A0A1F4RCU2_UNCSA|nr:MAG: hypothetical protein A3H38_02500 [candidate division WOR-1 bacterium RIFCSPLOWO2_02_FULL_46_20]